MRILITGITGRIGANVAAALRTQGHAIRGLVWARDARVEKLEALEPEIVEGSLTAASDVRAAVAGVDAVYHLGAAFQAGGPFTVDEYFEINVRGTFNVLEAARAAGSVQQVIVASTDAIYDKYLPDGVDEPIREDHFPRRPRGWYALTKSLAEDLAIGYYRSSGLPVTVVRFANVVGAGELLDFAQFYLTRSRRDDPALERVWQESGGEERLLLLRDRNGRPFKKHFADVRDIVHGCVAALGKSAAIGEVFQLGAPEPLTWDTAIPYLAERLGIPYVDIKVTGTPTHYEYDLNKARSKIGFSPRYGTIRMIDDALAFRRGEDIGVLPR